MKVTNTLNFDGSVVESENFNSSFYKVKLKVFAFGDNRNGSNFSPSSFSNKARQSIGLIPIVAKYNVDEDDLESHNVSLKKDNKGEYEFHYDTYPFGVVSNENNITLEEVNEGTEESPDIKTYVTVDNVFLWKRYEATKRIISWLEEGVSPKVSMEIDNVQGRFSDNGYFQIEDFEFQAITALGSEVEPCFPRAEIETYAKQDFKAEFKALVYELNETLKLNQQGGTGMEDKTEVTEVEATEVVEVFEETTVEESQVEQPVVETEVVEQESHTEEVFEVETTEATEAESTEEVVEEQPVDEAEQVEEVEVIDYEAKFNELNTEFANLQEELSKLQTYKRTREEEDLQAKFADKLSDDEFAQVFTEMKDSELDKVEEKLFALIGKKNFSVTAKSTTVNKVKLSLPKENDSVQSPYGDIFEK